MTNKGMDLIRHFKINVVECRDAAVPFCDGLQRNVRGRHLLLFSRGIAKPETFVSNLWTLFL
jgi:hypothetical protein